MLTDSPLPVIAQPISAKLPTNKNKTRKLSREDPRVNRYKTQSELLSRQVDKSNLPDVFAKSNRAYNSSNHHAKESNKHNENAKEAARKAAKFSENLWSMQDFGKEEYANVINPSAAMAPPQLPARRFPQYTEDTEFPDISSLSLEKPTLPPIGKKVTERGGKRKTRKSKKGTRKNKSRKHHRSSKK
jgi:hypothetical protein